MDREEEERQINFSLARRTNPDAVYARYREMYGKHNFLKKAMKKAMKEWRRTYEKGKA